MTSTFFGLVAGIVLAAYLTTEYSDPINRQLGQWLRQHGTATASTGPERTQETVADAEPDSAAVAAAETAPQAVESAPEPVALAEPPAESGSASEPEPDPVDVLEQRWAAFAAQADSLQPAGDFRYRHCFARAAVAHGVPEALLLAIASGESGFDPAARSDKDAIGVMQIRWPDTSHHLGIIREADLYDPCTNINAGARYMAELSERFDYNLHRAVAAYNYGPSRIENGAMPAGARWYSQYIYQHLQRVLDRPHVASSELIRPGAADGPGAQALIAFNQAYRARDYKAFLEANIPGLELAYRSEVPGLHEVVLLYQDQAARQRALEAIRASGLLASTRSSDRSISL